MGGAQRKNGELQIVKKGDLSQLWARSRDNPICLQAETGSRKQRVLGVAGYGRYPSWKRLAQCYRNRAEPVQGNHTHHHQKIRCFSILYE